MGFIRDSVTLAKEMFIDISEDCDFDGCPDYGGVNKLTQALNRDRVECSLW